MITVFLGTYNRLETLERTIRSYRKFRTPHEIVIVDNGTDHPDCLRLLERLAKQVKKVYNLPACVSMEEATDNFNIAIRDQYETSDAEWFAVTEADVCFDGTHPGAFAAYLKIAKATGYAVGPHLRVDPGIPAGYPLRNRVLACETWMQYRRDMTWLDKAPYSRCQIDTTFHLFPRRRFFDRLRMDPVRVARPYDAIHLDWYLNIHAPNRENRILIPDERPMGSWGKAWLRDYWQWFQADPADAFERLMREPLLTTDLCNVSFIRSWCYQYGHGCEQSFDESERWLRQAIPYPHDYYWPHEESWMRMIYADDFSGLGWE